jgi:hypothetical protein
MRGISPNTHFAEAIIRAPKMTGELQTASQQAYSNGISDWKRAAREKAAVKSTANMREQALTAYLPATLSCVDGGSGRRDQVIPPPAPIEGLGDEKGLRARPGFFFPASMTAWASYETRFLSFLRR